MYWPYNFSRGSNFLLRSTENAGDRKNHFSDIGVNAKSATNFRSSSAMRGAEFHENTRRDGPTRISSIRSEAPVQIDTNCVFPRPAQRQMAPTCQSDSSSLGLVSYRAGQDWVNQTATDGEMKYRGVNRGFQ